MLKIATFIADIISLMFSDNKKWGFHFLQPHDHRQNRKFPKRNVIVAKPLIWADRIMEWIIEELFSFQEHQTNWKSVEKHQRYVRLRERSRGVRHATAYS